MPVQMSVVSIINMERRLLLLSITKSAVTLNQKDFGG